ncbi:MAG: rod shape-determining protein [Clostridia bacterium]|nr:rod shape-determining protein [Clostridia bacterium]
MTKFRYAIEIGGAYTKIYVNDMGYALCEPTLVSAEATADGYQITAIGQDAKDMIGKTNDSTEVFSPISNGKIMNYEYLKQMLIGFFAKVDFRKNIDSVIVLINCGITEHDRENYLNLMHEIGFKEVELVPTALCALYGAGKNISSTKANLIVNIGGANTDIAVVNLNSIIKGATLGLGGKAVDVAIANTIAQNDGVVIGLVTSEQLKREVGSLYQNDTLNMEVTGVDIETKVPRTYIISASDIALVLKPFFDEVIRSVDVTLASLAPEITHDIINSGVIFTGGMSNVSGLEDYFKRNLKYPFKIVEDAESVAIMGAGKLLNDDRLLKKIVENT